ncbi:hypothetical protein PISMIDRAFT_16447 [Pisolithus microcarpus 441]|uniref:Unplaced genomic scaffold scaffold_203, whole genome shotgun sequence n=1 Tax=Pisolithus microcarpus 441 TaxID=765257 RepID=A0A0C9XT96_9AGAM|nr:hypothetical protein PISMIDRAFT_16447 [Pisolithus microcarpus 441]
MPAGHISRSSLPITTKGMGKHFCSPRKVRNKKKTSTTVPIHAHAFKRKKLLNELADLLAPPPSEPGLHIRSVTTSPTHPPMGLPEPMELEEELFTIDNEEASSSNAAVERTCITHVTDKSISLCASWKAVIRTIIDPFIKYMSATLGKPLPVLQFPLSSCTAHCPEQKATNILCLFFDRFLSINILSCDCSSLPQTLVSHGLFPTAPSQPRMAVSVELLSFYRALFERSCDAINALAAALNTYYSRRGFRMTNPKGTTVKDPFRRGLSQATQWYAILQVEVEKQVNDILQHCQHLVKPSLPSATQHELPSQGSCAEILIQRCPACFGGVSFGRSLDKGGDIHVAMDGNFHHRHRRLAGDSPSFYEPSYFLPKAQVDAIGRRITRARQHPSKGSQSTVPDEAIDQCEASYEVVDGQKQKASTDGFDDTGLMALICEQQKYGIALIDHLFSLLPPQANVVVLYDVGCVLSRSLSRFDIFDRVITSRLRFATTAMHAYGHEWACQLVYNPRLISGLGLSDGEAAIGYEMRTELGDWIRHRLKKGVREQGSAAQEALDNCGVSITELQEQWANQRAAQLSIRAYAPTKLKKELDTVLSLQADLDTTTKVIQMARENIERENVTPSVLDALASMERSHARLVVKAEALYSSLNVHDQFPELTNVSLDFVRTLLMARDLKINIRKRAISSFFEWDKLDRAVGGKDKPLGTKLHQQTWKAIAKCQPMLMAAIRKYNTYCEHLSQLYDSSWAIPLPCPLPTKLVDLRNDTSLMEDVWITPSPGETPRWLEDADVRDGIRALLKQERCLEEQRRLSLEADNMCRWFGYELSAIQVALRQSENGNYHSILRQRLEAILELQDRWPTVLCSSSRYDNQAKVSIQLAHAITGAALPSLCWLAPVVVDDHTNSAEDEDMWGLTDLLGPDPPDLSLEPEQIALSDVLGVGHIDDQDELEPEAETLSRVSLRWKVPHVRYISTINAL